MSRLTDRLPPLDPEALVGSLVPPPRFDPVRFQTYRPDPREPSQAAALERCRTFAAGVGAPAGRGRLLGRRPATQPARGLYLDGGFGVGKTHLLASLWSAAPAPKGYATFVEVTNLVGALGFGPAVRALAAFRLLCIDEFELDDPGDTVLVSTLLSQLSEAGVALAATSNTQPEDLGAGRFAAADFLREISGLARSFDVVRIEGEDYRHRGQPPPPAPWPQEALRRRAASVPGATLDTFADLCAHLSRVHPSRYRALVAGVSLVCLQGVRPLTDQNTGLRLVALVDRLYDQEVPVAASGSSLGAVFPPEFLAGGYRKKYSRALSRLAALARAAAD